VTAVPESALVDRVRLRLAADGAEPSPAKVAEAVRREGVLLGDDAVLDIVDEVRRESVGAGALEPLLNLPGVTDVLVNGPGEVFVDDGEGLRMTPVRFPDDASVRRLAQRLAAGAGRRLDDASPYVDVRLRDGTRFHAVLCPPARPGTLLSLRVPSRRFLSLDDLVARGLAGPLGAELLAALVDSRQAFVISGGTGSGKTTLLGALLSRVPPSERLVLVEDSAELQPRHPHVVWLEARPANVEGQGAISLRDLVRQALRMRPDRLVVGEVRGAEVVDLLAALNTGHEGGCGTIHANSAGDVPARFEALGIAAGMSREAVRAQLSAAIALVLHLVRGADGVRRLDQVAVLQTGDEGARCIPAVSFAADGAVTAGPARDQLARLLAAGP
jgi:pilus assembly protein CpaF